MRGTGSLVRRLAVLCLVLVGLLVAADVAASDPPTADEPARGQRHAGLEVPAAGGPCVGFSFQVTVAGRVGCTHGPDPAPPGIDVRVAPSLGELRERAAALHAALPPAAAPSGGSVQSSAAGSTPCVGNGTAGRRTEAIYAHWVGDPSRYDEIAPLIRTWAAAADAVFDESAAKTGGSRHLRWRHDAGCQLIVHEVAISSLAATNFVRMMEELYLAGFDRLDRRYVVWADLNVYCGIAVTLDDDRPGQDNEHNGGDTAPFGLFARIDAPCWGVTAPDASIEAHEISHTLGSVQPTAPNTSSNAAMFFGHCVDEYDTMCYADGTDKPLVYRCPLVHERLFDCQDNDYFSTDPPPGSYLATHWNTASSSFLVTVDPVGGFLDVGASIFGADIAWLAASGITKGCTADQEAFCPLASVTRGQMAAFLSRAVDLPATTADFFTDDAGSLFEGDINRLAAAGITKGCGPTSYCPEATITREQMAAFLARALSLPGTTADFFTDDEGSPFEGDINRLAAAGITSGCGPSTFCPATVVTREQMAAFLHRAFG